MMRMECPACGLINDSENRCPRCGGRMRPTLLGALEPEGPTTVKVAGQGPPTAYERVLQFVVGSVFVHVAAGLLAFAVLIVVRTQQIDPTKFHTEHPQMFQAAVASVLISATAIGIMLALRDIYLAQLVGAAIGFTSGLAVCFELWLVRDIVLPWYFWALLPWVTAGAGFFAGLRVAGTLQATETFEYRPVTSWDEKTKPKSYELDVHPTAPWRQMAIGSIVAVSAGPVLYNALFFLLRPLYKGNLNALEIQMQSSATLFWGLGLLTGAIVGGAKMPSGIRQGLGVAVAFLLAFHLVPREQGETAFWLIAAPIIGIIGGLLGRALFPPFKIFTNADERMPT